jgi:hypothetical protein
MLNEMTEKSKQWVTNIVQITHIVTMLTVTFFVDILFMMLEGLQVKYPSWEK